MKPYTSVNFQSGGGSDPGGSDPMFPPLVYNEIGTLEVSSKYSQEMTHNGAFRQSLHYSIKRNSV